ncbi:MAG: hypothetical protein NC926_08555 [Candidatus Omnitrophica bacterium]|nr:hypothetical protein [Candidatus Omnitrophota bacterium]
MKYFEILNKLLKEELGKNFELFFEKRDFHEIRNKDEWICVKSIGGSSMEGDLVGKCLAGCNLPYFFIDCGNVYYFYNFDKFYKKFILYNINNMSRGKIENSIGSLKVFYNYNIIWFSSLTFRKFGIWNNTIIDTTKKLGLDYAVFVENMYTSGDYISVECIFNTEKFEFKEWYLSGFFDEEDNDKITFSFLTPLFEILRKLQRFTKISFSKRILLYNKEMFLACFEDIFRDICKRNLGIDYVIDTSLSIEERIKRMEDFVKDIEFKKVYS